jgi:hypothetical protein
MRYELVHVENVIPVAGTTSSGVPLHVIFLTRSRRCDADRGLRFLLNVP